MNPNDEAQFNRRFKMSVADYTAFKLEFYREFAEGKYKGIRFGQAFWNQFAPTGINGSNPELFYADSGKAQFMIEAEWVDYV